MPDREEKPLMDGALLVVDPDVDEELDAGGSPGEAGDGKAERARDMLEEILAPDGSRRARSSIREDAERVVLDVDGEDAGRAIGKKGQTLDALQFLVNKIVNRFPKARRHVIVDSATTASATTGASCRWHAAKRSARSSRGRSSRSSR